MRRESIPLLIEGGAMLAAVLVVALGAEPAAQAALADALGRVGELQRDPEDVLALARIAALKFALGVVLVSGARVVSLRRGVNNIPAPALMPAVFWAAALGLLVQLGYGDPLHAIRWPGPAFANAVLIASGVAALILLFPKEPEELIDRFRNLLPPGILLAFVLLAAFGHGPQGSGARINLGPFQPLELVKVAFVLFGATYLARRIGKLRWQRERVGLLRIPRPALLLPALLVIIGLFAGLFIVGDLGPTLILSLAFGAMFYLTTRSPGWVLAAVAAIALLVAVVANNPQFLDSQLLNTRMQMWLNPWLNGLPRGDQLASAHWAIAAGGSTGRGLGEAAVGVLPAGHTDLVIAHLAEELGTFGVVAYLTCMSIFGLSGLLVAAANRTPLRALLAAGLTLLILCQLLVIFCGTTGLLPLTGVVAPFLSSGGSAMLVFMACASLTARLAESGRPRAQNDDLDQLRGALIHLAGALMLLMCSAVGIMFWLGVIRGPATSVRGVVTTLRDGTVLLQHDRRLTDFARRLPRGEILDREGNPLVSNDASGRRSYPLGKALGTLIGPPSADLLRPAWSLERNQEQHLRGYPDAKDGPAVWMARDEQGEHLLFAVASRIANPQDQQRAELESAGRSIRLLPLPNPDLSGFVPLLHMRRSKREQVLNTWAAAIEERSVRLTLDADLQEASAQVLQNEKERGQALATAIIDVDTGQVLARAQYPDFDPAKSDWRRRLLQEDPGFIGVYGPWPDKTGARGFFQAGSIAKLFTALAAARTEGGFEGQGCAAVSEHVFSCSKSDRQGPSFGLPDWVAPIHDHSRMRPHGAIDLSKALAVSCNVFFAQLALDLGPTPLKELAADGMEIAWSDSYEPGKEGSRRLAESGFGQGAAAMNVVQAARMVAAVGAGGVYRRCPPSMLNGADCEQHSLVTNPSALTPILAGMRGAATTGTAHRLPELAGIRLYAKTGTAQDIGHAEEEPFGIEEGATKAPEHAWILVLAEPDSNDPCDPQAGGRIAIAVLVARGGSGSGAALPVATQILHAINDLGYFSKQP